MKLKRVYLNNTSIEELTEAIKYNCIVTEQMEQKMEVLEKGKFSKNRIQTQQIQKQTPITTPREQPENNDEKDFLIPYIETFNSYHPEERKEFLQMTEQNIEESEYIRLLILLQLQSARNLIELKEMVTDYFEPFDYIFGDYSNDKVRLKGYYDSQNKKATKINDIQYVEDYKKDYCNYGAKTFLLKKIK